MATSSALMATTVVLNTTGKNLPTNNALWITLLILGITLWITLWITCELKEKKKQNHTLYIKKENIR